MGRNDKFLYEQTSNDAGRLARTVDAMRSEREDLLAALRLILPLAEAYLRNAPSDPDNSKLETARTALAIASRKQ